MPLPLIAAGVSTLLSNKKVTSAIGSFVGGLFSGKKKKKNVLSSRSLQLPKSGLRLGASSGVVAHTSDYRGGPTAGNRERGDATGGTQGGYQGSGEYNDPEPNYDPIGGGSGSGIDGAVSSVLWSVFPGMSVNQAASIFPVVKFGLYGFGAYLVYKMMNK